MEAVSEGALQATLHWRHPVLDKFRPATGYMPLFKCPAVPSVRPDIAFEDLPGAEPLALRRCIGTVGFFVLNAFAMLGYRPEEGDEVLVFATQPSSPDAASEADGPLPLDAPLRLENGQPRSTHYYLHIVNKAARRILFRPMYPKSLERGQVKPSVAKGHARYAQFSRSEHDNLVCRDGVAGRMAELPAGGTADDCHLEPSSRGIKIFNAIIEGRRRPPGIPVSSLNDHRAGLRLEQRLHRALEHGHLGFFAVPNYTAAADGSPLQAIDSQADYKLLSICARLLPVTTTALDVPGASRALPDSLAALEVPLHLWNYAWAAFWAGKFGSEEYDTFCEYYVPEEVTREDKRKRTSATTGSASANVDADDTDDDDPTEGDGGGGKRSRPGGRGEPPQGGSRGQRGAGGGRGRRGRGRGGRRGTRKAATGSIGELVASNEDAPFRYDSPSVVETWSRRVAAEAARIAV